MRIAWLLIASALRAVALDAPTQQLAHDILKQLIEINTSHSVGSTTVAAEAMQQRLLNAGFAAADLTVLGPNDRRGNLVARYRGTNTAGRKPILIIAHLDVVEARREDWTTDPFQMVEKDGYFYGRGTQDMKSQDAIMVTNLIRFKHEGYQPDRDIILALTADEEGGKDDGVDWLLKQHRDLIDAEYVLNPDAGGVYTDNGKPVDIELEVTEKLYASFQLKTTNPGGHSSLPVPDNAIYHITDALARLEHSPFPFELNAVTRAYFKQLASADKEHAADMNAILETPPDEAAMARLSREPQFNALMRTTCIPTMLQAGHADNALPQTAEAVVNCRILPGHSAEEVRQELIRIFADPQVMVRFMDPRSGEISDRATDTEAFAPVAPPREIVEPLKRIAGEIWPGAPVIPDMETGASDSIYTIAAGLPSYGFSGLAIDRNDIRAHGKDERLLVTSYDQGVEFFYRYLKALTSAP